MLNPFPELLTFALLAPFLLRIVVGLFFLYSGWRIWSSKESHYSRITHALVPAATAIWIAAVLEIATGISLVFGVYVQIGALVGVLLSLGSLISLRGNADSHARMVYVFTGAICLSLLVLGAGLFAFDIPL